MRLFIASAFPDLEISKPALPPASWVRPASRHLTYAFLGEQDESVVHRIDIDPGPPFEARLQGCGFFPNRHNARVGWIGLEPAEQFIELAGRVRRALVGIDFDQKEFRPHLTLMRIRDRWPPLAIEMFENAFRDFRSPPFTVATVTLYASRLTPTGAIHNPLKTWGSGL